MAKILIAQGILDITDIVMFKTVGPILFICKCDTEIFCAPIPKWSIAML